MSDIVSGGLLYCSTMNKAITPGSHAEKSPHKDFPRRAQRQTLMRDTCTLSQNTVTSQVPEHKHPCRKHQTMFSTNTLRPANIF